MTRRLPLLCAILLVPPAANADIAWLDFQGGDTNAAPLFTAFPAQDGATRSSGGITFTLSGAGVAARDRALADPALTDFAFVDGPGAALRLRLTGLPAGSYAIDSWHYDGGNYAGAVKIDLQRVGDPAPTPLVANQAFATTAASYTITADGTSSYDLIFTENDANDRVRLNALKLRSAGSSAGPPGIFIDADATRTAAVGGSPDPFWTDSVTAAGFTAGNLWRRRTGFGFDVTGHREIFEKDANGGVGDAAPLVTTATGLTPGRTYGVHIAYLSVPTENWQVKGGLAADRLELFTPTAPGGRVADLGLSGETGSNRRQYLGFIGNATADASGTLRLFADDGDGVATNWTTRTWWEGFLLGDPVVPPALPGNAVEIAPDGAWTWFNDERAIFHRGSLFAGYVLSSGYAGITRYDPATGERFPMVLGTAASQQVDDHNNPSITALPDGRLMALYSKHIAGNQFFQRISTVPLPSGDADWGPEIAVTTPQATTYANTYLLHGEADAIYNFHRCINFNPTLTISTDQGATWGPSRQLIGTGSGNTRPYPRYVSNGQDRIDLIYTDGHPRDVANSVYHLFYRDGQLRRTDGSVIDSLANIPLDHDGGKRGSLIYGYSDAAWGPGQGPDDWIPGGRGWTWDIHYGKDGQPVCVFQVQKDEVTGAAWSDDRIYYYYARWTGTEWQKRFIAQAGRPLYAAEDDYGAGMCLDPADPRVVYLASNAAAPFDLSSITNVPLRPNARYEIWRGFTADGGLTFSWTPVTENSTADNLRPIVPQGHGREECLLWFYGTYSAYTSYSTRVVGRFGAPLTSFTDWAAGYGLANAPDADADGDGDGLSNLLEFALGGDPTDPTDPPLPQWRDQAFVFPCPAGRGGVDWQVEDSEDLASWHTAAIVRSGLNPAWQAEGVAIATPSPGFRAVSFPTTPQAARRFVRLRAIGVP